MFKFTEATYIVCFLQSSLVQSSHYIWGGNNPTGYVVRKLVSDNSDVGSPLILTPYIEQGDIKNGRLFSEVKPEIGGWPSFSGYFTVNKVCGSNLFFWFIPARNDWLSAPVLLWLQGGPGAGSLYGLFEEIGPFNHFPNGLKERAYTWNTDNNIIYIDQPVGSGYSFTKSKCFAKNMTTVTNEAYIALTQFFKLFPELQKNKFFLTGESFAGHYIPALGLFIHNNNPTADVKINLVGILIGNPLTKLSCHDYASFLYSWGVVKEDLRDQIIQRQEMLKVHAEAGEYLKAWKDWDYILNNLIGDQTYLSDRECMVAHPSDKSDYVSWVDTPTVRRQLHVGNTQYNDVSWDVYNNLVNTIAEPMTSAIEQLLQAKNYSVGFYSGNLDLICLTTSTECLLNGLQWWGCEDFQKAPRESFSVDGNSLSGWVQTAGPLYLVVIKDSGHTVPAFQPNVTLMLISKVTSAPSGVNPGSLLLL